MLKEPECGLPEASALLQDDWKPAQPLVLKSNPGLPKALGAARRVGAGGRPSARNTMMRLKVEGLMGRSLGASRRMRQRMVMLGAAPSGLARLARRPAEGAWVCSCVPAASSRR